MNLYRYRSAYAAAICLTLSLCACSLKAQVAPLERNGIETLTDYFDMLRSGNIESAGYMWTESALERSSRFGITYTDIPLKIDATSPIIRHLDMMKGHLQRPVKNLDRLANGAFSRMTFATVVMGKLIEHDYWAARDGEYYWLCYPQDFFSRDWEIVESKYLRIHVHPDMRQYLNEVTLEDADRGVEHLAKVLGLDTKFIGRMSEVKIEYFYCNHDSTVKEITGHLTKGTTDLASNDIISAFFPHYHELVHLLVNMKMHEMPLYTLPLMREGIAVHHGGRWGKAPSALDDLGGFLVKEKFIEIDSILTLADFERNAQADIAYPVAGLFAGYLMGKLGWDGYQRLYLELSGEFDSLYAMGKETIKTHFLAAVGIDTWDNLIADFIDYIITRGEEDRVIKPGALAKGDKVLSNDRVIIKENGDWMSFEFKGGESQPAGNLLFGHDKRLVDAHSFSFDEQYPDSVSFDGYRFGIRYDTNEAGLYDYVSNQLVAKYIWGITPSEDYYDQSTQRIAISLRKDLIGKLTPSEKDHKMLAN